MCNYLSLSRSHQSLYSPLQTNKLKHGPFNKLQSSRDTNTLILAHQSIGCVQPIRQARNARGAQANVTRYAEIDASIIHYKYLKIGK